jgi:tetratricopeptide (TPR) repeat protein
MRKYRTKEAIIASDAPPNEIKALGKRLDYYCKLFGEFYDEIGLKRKNSNTLKIRVFDSYSDFDEYYQRSHPSKKSTPLAYFSPSLNSVVMYNDNRDVALRAVVFHECSHQYLNRYSYDVPKWLNEGLAEYFEGWKVETGVAATRTPHLYDLSVVRTAIAKGKYLTPEKLVNMSNKEFSKFKADNPDYNGYLHYATAWSFLYFCLEASVEKDREPLIAYLKELTKKGPSAKFLVEDWPALNARWERWVENFEVEPETATEHFLVAVGARRNGKWEAAIKSYDRALELDPTLPRARTWLGYCLTYDNKFTRAIKELKQAFEEDPEEHWAAYLLADIYLGRSRPSSTGPAELALEYAETASDIVDDKKPRYLWMRARCLEKLGEDKKAIRIARKILKIVEDEDLEFWEGQIDELRALTRK